MAFLFAGYNFDRESGLSFGGRAIQLPPKERDLLHFLLQSHGKIVSKDDVVREVWRGGHASDESISRAVYRLRLAMQAAGGPPVVSTVYNGGFRISAPVQFSAGAPGSSTMALLQTNAASRVVPLVISGREYAARQTSQDAMLALQAATAATQMDAAYVPAWIAIAELHVLEALRYLRPAKEAGTLAVKAAEKALALNAQCGPAMAVRGWVRGLIDRDLVAGLQDLDAALQMDAEYALTSVLRAGVLQALGRHADAVDAARRAQLINAYAYNGQAVLPLNLLYSGQAQPALETAQKLGRLFPALDSVQEAISIIFSAHDRHDDALAYAQRAAQLSPHSASLQTQLAYALARLNRQLEATGILESMSGPAEPFACMAPVHVAMGDAQGAVKKLQQAKERRDPHFFAMRDDPRLATLRGTRAFEALWDARP